MILIEISNNEMVQSWLTIGFIRDIWNEYNIGMYRFPPQYLIKLIEAKVKINSEFLHLFIKNDLSHFCIPLDNVMRQINV